MRGVYRGGVKMENKPSVSLCMIVKNEESCLEKCLASMQDLVSEIIIVDTGSTDGTIEIAQKYHAVVETYKWQNDFSKARNYSLSLATQEWILVLDADEYLRESDRELFRKALEKKDVDSYYIKTLSFTQKNNSHSCVINLNHRLFRRSKGFYYTGAIHEQLVTKQVVNSQLSEIGFYHTGYLREVVSAKNKPLRNKAILEELLKQNPNSPFHQFNYANELAQLHQYDEAVEFYNKAYRSTSPRQGYMPKLMIFRINTLIANGQEREALAAANEGIKIYPRFTYLMFIKGTLEERLGFTTKAIRSYEACLTLGKPEAQFEFSSASEGLWPHLKLATLYERYEDYEMAIDHYKKYLMIDSSQYKILYSIASCLNRMGITGETLAHQLEAYLPQVQTSYQVLLIDLLMKQKCFEVANGYLKKSRPLEKSSQLVYLYGKNQFYLGNYEESDQYFKKYMALDCFNTVERYYYLMYLFTGHLDYSVETLPYAPVYHEIDNRLQGRGSESFGAEEFKTITYLIEELLLLSRMEWILRIEQVINPMLSLSQRLELAQIYSKYQAHDQVQAQLMTYFAQGGEPNLQVIQLLDRWQRK